MTEPNNRIKTPQAVEDCHDFLLWLIPHLDKFPRNRRFTLGERLKTGMLEVLEQLVPQPFWFASMGMTERQAPAWLYAGSAKLELGVPSGTRTQKPENAGCQDKAVLALVAAAYTHNKDALLKSANLNKVPK